jgi:hypothetical protein
MLPGPFGTRILYRLRGAILTNLCQMVEKNGSLSEAPGTPARDSCSLEQKTSTRAEKRGFPRLRLTPPFTLPNCPCSSDQAASMADGEAPVGGAQ